MKTTHTHTGNCQVCGAMQAAANDNQRLAKHGYTTRWGFFSGVCTGSDNLPFQLDCSLVKQSIVWAQGQLKNTLAYAAELRATTDNSGFHGHYVKGHYKGSRYVQSRTVTVPATFRAITKSYRDGSGTYEVAVIDFTYEGEAMTYGTEPSQSVYGTAAEAAKKSREYAAQRADAKAGQLRDYIAHQQRRVDTWSVQPLVPAGDNRPAAAKLVIGSTFTYNKKVWAVVGLTEERAGFRGKYATVAKCTRVEDGRAAIFRPCDVLRYQGEQA